MQGRNVELAAQVAEIREEIARAVQEARAAEAEAAAAAQGVPAPPAPPAPGAQRVVVGGPAGVAQLYQAARAQRRELREQLSTLESARSELRRELGRDGGSDPVVAKGIQARIETLDQQIALLDKQIAAADARVAQYAGVPGAVVEPRRVNNDPPEEAIAIGVVFMVFVLFPISIAIARRIWKRGSQAVMRMPAEWNERMHRLEQAVDTIAVEIERVTEGQRFMTRVMTERGLGAGPAQPVDVGARETVNAPRGG